MFNTLIALLVVLWLGGIVLVSQLLELQNADDKWWERLLLFCLVAMWPIPLVIICIYVYWNDYIRK